MTYEKDQLQELSELSELAQIEQVVAGVIVGGVEVYKMLTAKGPDFPQEYAMPIASLPQEYIPFAIADIMKATGAAAKKAAAQKALTTYSKMAIQKYGAAAAVKSAGVVPQPTKTNWLLWGGMAGGVTILILITAMVVRKRRN